MGVCVTLGEVSLSEDDLEMKQAARKFADRHVLQQESHIGLTGAVPDDIGKTPRDLGYYRMTIPVEYGGLGLGHLRTALWLRSSPGRRSPYGTSSTAPTVSRHGSSRGSGPGIRKNANLPGIAAGEIVPAITVTEPETGSDVQSIRTTATRVEECPISHRYRDVRMLRGGGTSDIQRSLVGAALLKEGS
jgi:alkylation response protein AidB-like acyl-CoA dehydrogenase